MTPDDKKPRLEPLQLDQAGTAQRGHQAAVPGKDRRLNPKNRKRNLSQPGLWLGETLSDQHQIGYIQQWPPGAISAAWVCEHERAGFSQAREFSKGQRQQQGRESFSILPLYEQRTKLN